MTNPRDINCETQCHLWGPGDKCVMCKEPKPAQPSSNQIVREFLHEIVKDYGRRTRDDYPKCPPWGNAIHVRCATVDAIREYLRTADEPKTGRWYAAEDIDRLVRELDVIINGEAGA